MSNMETPRHRVRINISKNTKGYTHETTAEVEWDGDPSATRNLIARLLKDADEAARLEIRHREHADAQR